MAESKGSWAATPNPRSLPPSYRRTSQELAPARHEPTSPGSYDIYPAFSIAPGSIHRGIESLAKRLARERFVTIDGYSGVLWEDLRDRLGAALDAPDGRTAWVDARQALRREPEIDALIGPFLGGDDPLWGTRFTGTLRDFYDLEQLAGLRPDPDAPLTILFGPGAALAGWEGLLIYLDVPKNEIQFRSRAGSIVALGASAPTDPKAMYKRFYFVEWPALNTFRKELLPRIDAVVDTQRPDDLTWMEGDTLRSGIDEMARSCFRPRPWFEPGPWGGQWIKRHIPSLPVDPPNYAWSFELIAPENGVSFESNGLLLEVAFDTLMHHASKRVLGRAWDRFRDEFPIRFDFLDTVDGGNLSIQCHPRPEYARHHFGENFTQDETYYLLDCVPGSRVYLGFRQGIDVAEFRTELERSESTGAAIDVDRFVHTVPARRHDLLLIPHGTIHGSGRGNLVLEISATPYIFTFKMYDWVRRDLEGNLRPINIRRAFDNLYFDRTAARIESEFIAHPEVIASGADWRIVHLPTHGDHFYDVLRYEFAEAIEASTEDTVHVLSLVEGRSIICETPDGRRQRFNYAETFVVPAAAGKYRLINEGTEPVKVVRAWVK